MNPFVVSATPRIALFANTMLGMPAVPTGGMITVNSDLATMRIEMAPRDTDDCGGDYSAEITHRAVPGPFGRSPVTLAAYSQTGSNFWSDRWKRFPPYGMGAERNCRIVVAQIDGVAAVCLASALSGFEDFPEDGSFAWMPHRGGYMAIAREMRKYMQERFTELGGDNNLAILEAAGQFLQRLQGQGRLE